MADVSWNWQIGKHPIYFSIRKYDDGPLWGWRWLGRGRRALDCGTISLIFEWMRQYGR